MREKPLILIVDDEKEALETMEGILEAQDYDIIRANDGVEAINIAKHSRPDLVIMDITMPKLDGIAACRFMKTSSEKDAAPVIILTAKENIGDVEKAFEAGADEYVHKPVDWGRLLPKIRKFLGSADK